MYEYAVAWEWLSFAARWLHVITAIAWIGSSFYFIALDLGLVKRPHLPVGAYGEEWQVHGGGFYHIQKYLVAPAQMPEHLTWFKWESYATWLSGFLMLAIVYYGGADLFLIDTHVMELSQWQAIAISVASLAIGWVIYDQLCKSPVGKNTWGLMAVLYVVLVVMGWGYTQVFTGRAAFLHLGAFTATIMSANVFFIIIPNQKIVVAALIADLACDRADLHRHHVALDRAEGADRRGRRCDPLFRAAEICRERPFRRGPRRRPVALFDVPCGRARLGGREFCAKGGKARDRP